MNFTHAKSDLFVPDAQGCSEAMTRTTHLGVGAHQDDLEFMALHGILQCFQRTDRWFGGVTCTDGAGSARTGPYASFSDEQMKSVRVKEQRTASVIGQYSFMAQLAHPSSVAKNADQRIAMVDDLEAILKATQPEVVYTHNPLDKHATHIGVFQALLSAIKRLPESMRPKQLIGCEVWRGFDWLPDQFKLLLSLDAHPNLAASLNGVFDSQIVGGKRYDLAVEGRRLANATFFDSHATDDAQRVTYALDMTELMFTQLTVHDFCTHILDVFNQEIMDGIGSVFPRC
ncbi:PIG-L deacetylase family protein [Cerasicoccus maritimus]|uniref:PIG-L deacetylase family protein n=1 Tax=Cerasicoccus maritimus TaxID=490089 RepID=UPI0028526775|nr:PIG-L family deacetylase [Cerasicoccus maritimus]